VRVEQVFLQVTCSLLLNQLFQSTKLTQPVALPQ